MPHNLHNYRIIALQYKQNFKSDGRKMAHTVLPLILILTTTYDQTMSVSLHDHCNSDEYSPSSSMADLQELTPVQYCLIDNCTIMRIDNGEQLDIVYTTESLLVVTPTDNKTTLLISKYEPELSCFMTTTSNGISINPLMRVSVFTLIPVAIVSAYIAVIHLIFRELHNTFGKLMILYNIFLVFMYLSIFSMNITHFLVAVHSPIPCYLILFLILQSLIISEGSATCLLAYLAYIMHQSYKCREVTKESINNFISIP